MFNEELSNLNLALNPEQLKIFIQVQHRTTKKIKALNCKKDVCIEPLRLFITGGEGVGKSHLMKTISMFPLKTINLYSGSSDKPKVLIVDLIGVAVMNINGATFNSGISIPSYVNKYTLPRLSYSERARLRDFAF